ncbi:MAG: tetratricopeptide repeat protein [Anaerolineae bacterium]|nr:tetratricopeptide repeat protein [Anaerolineae bacterium]
MPSKRPATRARRSMPPAPPQMATLKTSRSRPRWGALPWPPDAPDVAVEALTTALAASEADPALYNLLGRAYHAQGDTRRAMDAHALALRMQPDNLDYQYDFACAARDDG